MSREKQIESALRSRLRTIEQEQDEMEREVKRWGEAVERQDADIRRRCRLCESMLYGMEQDTQLRNKLAHSQEVMRGALNYNGMTMEGLREIHHKKKQGWRDQEEELYYKIRQLDD
jgi:hypothetical protein